MDFYKAYIFFFNYNHFFIIENLMYLFFSSLLVYKYINVEEHLRLNIHILEDLNI